MIERKRATAHGKIILLGEHTVVYGAPAVAAGIDRGASAEAWPLGAAEPSTLELAGKLVRAGENGDDLERAFSALLDQEGAPPPVGVMASSDLPAGGGLGSSAALGVAIARAIESLGSSCDEARVLARASAWERVFHGNPSGIDTTAASRGGIFRFVRGEGARPLAPDIDLWLCVGHSGVASSTRAMVEGVARLRDRKPEMVDASIGGITSLVDNAALAIEAGDLTGLGRLMDLNQMLLAGLMLSTEGIEAMCRVARSAGALGAKLTGAGGGGSVVALVASARLGARDVGDDQAALAADRILAAWRDAGYDGFVSRVRSGRRGQGAQP